MTPITFYLPREEFVSAIKRLVHTCEMREGGKATVPHFFYIRLDGYGDRVKLSAANSVRRAAVLIDNVIPHTPFTVGISGAYLNDLKNHITKGNTLLFGIEKSAVVITGEDFRVSFAILSGDRFPQDQTIEHSWVKTDYEELISAISKIHYCKASNDNPKAYTRAVSVTRDHLMCTDGFRLSFVPNYSLPTDTSFLIHADSALALEASFSGIDADGFIDIRDNEIHFSRGKVYMSSRLLAGEVPKFMGVVPQGPCAPCEVSREALRSALARLSVIAGEDKRASPVELYFGDNALALIAERDGNRITTNMPIIYSGGNLVIKMNLKYLTQAVGTIRDDMLNIELRGKTMPMVITDKKGDHKNVLVPQPG